MRTQTAALLLFSILIAAFGYFNRPGWNQNSRLDVLHAIVMKGKLAIDDYHTNTGDKAIFNGHFYSEKAPGIIPLALPAFVFSLFVTESRGLFIDAPQGWALSAWMTTVGTTGVLTALGGVATFALLAAHLKRRDAFLVSLFLFLGTIAFPYATMLFSHAAVIGLIAIAQWAVFAPQGTSADRGKVFACLKHWLPKLVGILLCALGVITAVGLLLPEGISLALLAFLALGGFLLLVLAGLTFYVSWHERAMRKGRDLWPPTRDILAGVCLGFAIASEYPAAIAAGGILLLAAWIPSERPLRIIAAAIPPLLLIPLNNFAVTGNIFSLAYVGHASFPVWHTPLLGFRKPALNSFIGLLFSEYRGLFFWSPFLLLVFVGWIDRRLPPVVRWVSVGVLFLTTLSISAIPTWEGGGAIGPRYIAACIPLLALPVAWGFRRLKRMGILLGTLSVLLMLLATAIGPISSEFERYPLQNIYLKAFPVGIDGAWNLGGRMGLSGMVSLLPLLIVVTVLLAYALRGLRSPEKGRTWAPQ